MNVKCLLLLSSSQSNNRFAFYNPSKTATRFWAFFSLFFLLIIINNVIVLECLFYTPNKIYAIEMRIVERKKRCCCPNMCFMLTNFFYYYLITLNSFVILCFWLCIPLNLSQNTLSLDFLCFAVLAIPPAHMNIDQKMLYAMLSCSSVAIEAMNVIS